MATTVDTLLVRIESDMRDLRNDLKKVNKETGAVASKFKGLGRLIGQVAVALGGFAAVKGIARVGMEFEDLRDSLNSVFGSIEAGDQAMEQILQFAQTTPFQIETVTKAFIALRSAGIEPNIGMLQTFADTASVSVDQLGVFEALVKTVQRSASGGLGLEELNMIMDRGVDVLGILNKELGLTKDDIAKFGATADGAATIVEALTKGLNAKFGGSMEAKMDNLSTKVSNAQIAFKGLADELYSKTGFATFLKTLADSAGAGASSMALLVRAIADGVGTDFLNMTEGEVFAGMTPSQKQSALLEKYTNQMGSFASSARISFHALAQDRSSIEFPDADQFVTEMETIAKMGFDVAPIIASMRARIEEEVDKFIEGTLGLDELDSRIPTIKANIMKNMDGLEQVFAVDIAPTKQALDEVNESVETNTTLTGEQVSAQAAMLQALKKSESELEKYSKAMEQLEMVTKDPERFGFTKDDVEKLRAYFAEVKVKIDEAADDVTKTQEQLDQLSEGRSIYESIIPESGFEQKLEALKAYLVDIGVSAEDTAIILNNFGEEVKLLDPAFAGLVDAASSASNAVGDAFADMITSGQVNLDSLKDIAAQFIKTIISMQIRLAVLNPMLNSMFGLNGTTGALPTGSLFSSPTGKATGGSVNNNMPYIVGERGPELFVPHSAGRIVNSNGTRSMSGGGVNNVSNNVYVTTGVQNTVRSEIMNLLPQISSAVQNDMITSNFRSGRGQ